MKCVAIFSLETMYNAKTINTTFERFDDENILNTFYLNKIIATNIVDIPETASH